ncbi:polyphenol oxidase family protein [Olsenella profusa]|uniref:polyphenol oxidase family protein n=1 Tax=Olsenella profusa TaxID=138595 RepID=UPI00315B34C7
MTLLTDRAVEGGVTFAFTERAGGVSEAPYASLNLGASCGDDPACVAENRRRALAAIGAEGLLGRLVCPRQVHGDHVVTVGSGDAGSVAAAQAEAEAGADAVVCTAPDVPVLLCFADCVPVVIVAPGGRGFAVAHSGWRGTEARIAATTTRALCAAAGCGPEALLAYVGPHIGAADYEVSEELAARFATAFGPGAVPTPRHLDLAFCVRAALAEAGVGEGRVTVCEDSTARTTGRFFSYRAEGGTCGRHGALAVLRDEPWAWPAGSKDDETKGEATRR